MELTFQRLSGRAGGVQQAIARASERTGVDFNYLLGQAQVESGLNAGARRPHVVRAPACISSSSKAGWASSRQHGEEHGMGWASDAIRQTASGRFTVSDPALRQQILGLRNDPNAASLMAAEHAADNQAALEGATGRPATGTDLYMAHFLGLGGARKFLSAMESNPGRSGAAMFPAAASANRGVFYSSDGRARSLTEIYDRFADQARQGRGGRRRGRPRVDHPGHPADGRAMSRWCWAPARRAATGNGWPRRSTSSIVRAARSPARHPRRNRCSVPSRSTRGSPI